MENTVPKILKLKRGEVELPAFFPDATKAVARSIDSVDIENIGTPGLVMNTYHLMRKPGAATLKHLGGLNLFSGFNGPILTDSGGFQVFSLIRENASYGQIRNNKIIFHPSGSGAKMILTPEKCIQAQFNFASDIMMCLDYCTHPDDDDDINKKSVDITIKWAEKCRAEFDKLSADLKGEKPKLFAIIQGAGDYKQRERCADALKEIGFDGYGFGGWPMDNDNKLIEGILKYTADLMPDDLPKYAMGIGRPEEIVLLYKMGYNLFDCVIPTREARHKRLYVYDEEYFNGQRDKAFYKYMYIGDEKYMRDTSPVSSMCGCHCCKNYSRAYLHHLFRIGDSLAYRLATIHNLTFYNKLMDYIRNGVL